jgi:hypothetical protein
VHRSQFEPKLLDMLADPVTQAVMDADRVDLRELIAMLSDIGHRLRGPHDAPVGLVQARFQAQPRRDL